MNEQNLRVHVAFPDGPEHCVPGTRLRARVTVKAPEDWRADYLDIVVFWRTEGLGDEDKGIVFKETPFTGGATVPALYEFPLAVEMPPMPWTYRGRTIKIRWFVGVYANPKPGGEIAREMEFLMHPRPELFDRRFAVASQDDDDDVEFPATPPPPMVRGAKPPPPVSPPRRSMASEFNPPAPPDVAPPD